MLRLIIILLLLFFGIPSFAASPVLFFSDMPDGNRTGWEGSGSKGMAVSVWGLNLGSATASNSITCAGQQIVSTNSTYIAEWGATTNPTTARSLERITFWLNSSMSTGAQTISVTTSEGTSNTLPFYVRTTGDIYFVSTSGSNSNDGETVAQAWRDPFKCRSDLTAGDVCYFKTGTYTAEDYDADIMRFRDAGGDSYNHNNGSANDSITIKSYPGEIAQFSGQTTIFTHKGSSGDHLAYWTFACLNLWANYHVTDWGIDEAGSDTNIRFVGNDCSTQLPGNPKPTILDFSGKLQGSTYLYILGNYVHDAGRATREGDPGEHSYGLYIEGYGDQTNVFIGYNEFSYMPNGKGIQIYCHDDEDDITDLYVFNNYIHHNYENGITCGGGDDTSSNQYACIGSAYLYGNIIWANNYLNTGATRENLDIGGVGWGRYGGNYYVQNNSFGDCFNNGDTLNLNGLGQPTSFTLQNNIILNDYSFYDDDSFANGDPSTADNNIYYGGASDIPTWEDDEITSDPDITDAPNGDFSISNSGSAYDSGETIAAFGFLTSSYPLDIWDIDYDYSGKPRGTFSIGAYEYEAAESSTPTVQGIVIH